MNYGNMGMGYGANPMMQNPMMQNPMMQNQAMQNQAMQNQMMQNQMMQNQMQNQMMQNNMQNQMMQNQIMYNATGMNNYRLGPQYYAQGALGYYGAHQYCTRCGGTGWNMKKGRPCKRCHKHWRSHYGVY